MKHIISFEFIKKPIFALLVCIYLVMLVFLRFFLNAEMTGFYLLYVLSRFIFYLDAVFMLIVFIACSNSYQCGVDETISALRGRGFYQTATVVRFGIAFIVIQVSIFFSLIIASINNDGTGYFLKYLWKSYGYNIFLPMLICILIAYFLSRWERHGLASIFLVAYILLISPASSLLKWIRQPAFPIDKIVDSIFHPFTILYESGIFSPNPQLGLQTDSRRGLLLLFWCLVIAALFVVVIIKKKMLRRAVALALSVLSLLVLVSTYLPSGRYVIEEKWDGYLKDLNFYYYENQIQTVGLSEDLIDYKIDDYTLNISFGRLMYVDGQLHFLSETPKNEFVFSLYHGYEITKIQGQGTAVQWSRDQDTVTVNTEAPLSELTLEIAYHGSHNIFFSFEEGATLPGWFPWYPMAGKHQVYVNYPTISSSYNPYNRIEPASVTLNIEKAYFPIASNLVQINKNTFQGEVDSITLVGGELVLTTDEQVKDILPLELVEDEQTFIDSLNEDWNTVCQTLELYGLKPPITGDFSIILASRDLCRVNINNDVAIFDDYILTWSGGLSIQTISQYCFLEQNQTSKLTNLVCSMGSLDDTPRATFDKWIQLLPMFEEDMTEEYSLAPLMYETLTKAKEAGKEVEVVQEIAQFLYNGPINMSEESFLEGLCDQYVTD